MEEKKPLVSIITVCLNSEKHIEQAILSVLNQSYSPIEYIIIDGESTDRTLDIIEKYKDRISCVISEKDEGIYDAMNKGIKKASGELIGILNSDDWYEKNVIEKIVKEYLSHAEPGVIHGNINLWQNDKIIDIKKPILSEEAKINFAWHPSCFMPKKIYNQYGLFEKKYKIAGDTELLLRLKSKGIRFYYLPEIITNFRMGGISDNTWYGISESWKIYKKYFSVFTAIKLVGRRTLLKQINNIIKKLMGEKRRKKISRAYHFLIRK